jgi:hypothetical protein
MIACNYCGRVTGKNRPCCSHCGSPLSADGSSEQQGRRSPDINDPATPLSQHLDQRPWRTLLALETPQFLGKVVVLAGIIMAPVMDWLSWPYAIGFLAGFVFIYPIMLKSFFRQRKQLLFAQAGDDIARSPTGTASEIPVEAQGSAFKSPLE